MKKLALAAILASTVLSVHAVEVGITATADHGGLRDTTGTGITVGQKVGAVGVTAGFDRFSGQDRFSLTTGYDIAKFGPVTITPKIGIAYLNNDSSADGTALTVGLGAEMPVTKQVSLTLDAVHQHGQNRVSGYDGNRVSAGFKYRF